MIPHRPELDILTPLVRDLATRLSQSRTVDSEALIALEAQASAFVLCYRRYATPHTLFELIAGDVIMMGSPARLGYWRLLFFWVKFRFKADFYVATRGRRKLLNNLLDLISQFQRKSRSNVEDVFECNCILLLILRSAQLYQRKPVLKNRRLMIEPTGSSSQISHAVSETLPRQKTFWGYSTVEVAEQMTLIDANMFRAIRPEEFYNKGWSDPSKAPILHMFISRLNAVSFWVASSIMCQTTASTRSRAVVRFLLIAQSLEEMGNYNSLASILGGLKLWAITRLQNVIPLHRTFRLLMAHLDSLVSPDNNYRSYRAVQTTKQQQGKPFIPYLGLYLKDLTFIEDGNNDMMNGAPNIQKINLFGKVLREIECYQRSCAEFNKRIVNRYPVLLDHLARFPRMTEEELNAASLALRPSNVPAVMEAGSSFSQESSSYDGSESSDMKEHAFGGDSSIVSRVLRFIP